MRLRRFGGDIRLPFVLQKFEMQRLRVILLAIAFGLVGGLAEGSDQVDEVAVGGRIKKPGHYDRIENESLAALINRVGGIPATQAELEQYERGERVLGVRIFLYRKGKKREINIDAKSNELWELKILQKDAVIVARAEPLEGVKYPAAIILKKQVAAQGGRESKP
ncbi:hypothetical protein OKA05_05885 [Luteolibacter arcticus]|uniref:POTRA domain-containing protein n=1 Tax=Luteolibacter arcticus TaxID=1581411 RepID=A0ABT3GGC6_9BACT|nr:hypothetical protein [Luteolibacter arcticus]MCW1922074.1 hypothetical protein [Luteolibacter arcticus]